MATRRDQQVAQRKDSLPAVRNVQTMAEDVRSKSVYEELI
jgi:hypothetical protein